MPVTARVGGASKSPAVIHGHSAGSWRRLRKGWTNVNGVWRQSHQDEVVTQLTSTGGSPVGSSYFNSADWGNPLLTKRLVIPAGHHIGANNHTYALAISDGNWGQAGSFAGDLIIDNYGTISGLGGQPNSGEGGSALWGNLPGRDGRKVIFNNRGLLRAGGGAGGAGGRGGTGYYHDYQHSGDRYNYAGNHYGKLWNSGYRGYEVYWDGARIFQTSGNWGNNSPPNSVDIGGWRYVASTYVTTVNRWEVSYVRRELITPNTIYTGGGWGGNGGRGSGYDGGAAGGAGGGGPHGANAGWGGNGGSGGDFGNWGAAGAWGGGGNAAGGEGPGGGGAPGYWMHGSGNIQFNNYGTVQGRQG